MDEDNILYSTPKQFLTIKKAIKHPSSFFYTERKGIDSIAVTLYDKTHQKVGLINETKPPFNERENTRVFYQTALGGSLFDMVNTEDYLCMTFDEQLEIAKTTALKELQEEVGYTVPANKMVFCKRAIFNSMSNEYTWLFMAEIDEDAILGDRDPQSEAEAEASLVWQSTDHSTFDTIDGKAAATIMFYTLLKGK